MPRSRLFRSVIVFGVSIGGGAVLATGGSAGCALYDKPDHHGSGWGIIDAGFANIADCGCVDAHWGIIDAPLPSQDGWPTIADAPSDGSAS